MANGSNDIDFSVPSDAVLGDTFARFRLSSAGVAGPTGAAADGEVEDHLVTIVQGTLLEVAATDASKAEGDSGATTFTFTVARSGDLSITSSATFAVTGNGVHQADGGDFSGGALPSGPVSFLATESSKIISLSVTGDTTFELDEGFTVTLSNASAGTSIVTATADGLIRDDDTVYDYGDAPDPLAMTSGQYPTLLASDGARHATLGMTLGTLRDFDADGQQSVDALGDDGDGTDDDDGVIFTAMTQGTPATATVTVANGPGRLYAWIDYNGNGVWESPSEQIATDRIVNNGVNNVAFTVSPSAVVGTTFARFRLATTSGLTPTGAALDGEVEDYAVTIAQAFPEIRLEGNGVEIVDGDSTPMSGDNTDFGNVAASGGALVETFRIRNVGTKTLNLTGSPRVILSGAQASHFSVSAQPSGSTVTVNGNRTFQISYAPAAVGTHSATVSIANDDSDENPYTFAIQGTGFTPVPEIELRGNGYVILNGDSTPVAYDGTEFGSVDIDGGASIQAFTIRNTGSLALSLTGAPLVAISGSSDFTISTQPMGNTVGAGGGTDMFEVLFDPSSVGVKTATVSIANNDSDENPHTFVVQGTGVYVYDFGDAPDTAAGTGTGNYRTKVGNGDNGARHTATGLLLGASRDAESEAVANSNASGDDVNGSDDEDGVSFSLLVVGQMAQLEATVSGGSGKLNAWIDYNRNGVWESPAEQVGDDVAVADGVNTIPFIVPMSATLGATFARIRLDSAGGLSPTGEAPDGEVEDYRVAILTDQPPVAQSFSPPDGATDVGLAANLSVIFNQSVQKGTGNITVFNDDTMTGQTIDVTSSDVTLSGATALINPPADLDGGGQYHVEIDAGAFESLAGTAHVGIADPTIWNFDTTGGAQTFVVSTLVDESDGNFAAGDLSLREAIEQANQTPAVDTVTFSVSGTITLTVGQLQVTQPVDIQGPGIDSLLLAGFGGNRILEIPNAGVAVTLGGMKLRNVGPATVDGGSIRNEGELTLSRVKFDGSATTQRGGAIFNETQGGSTATVTLARVDFDNCTASEGGAIFNHRGDVSGKYCSLVNCQANQGNQRGGAIFNQVSGVSLIDARVTFEESKFAGNVAPNGGGAIFNNQAVDDGNAEVNVYQSELRMNTAATGKGGAIWLDSGLLDIRETTVDGNTAQQGGGIALTHNDGASLASSAGCQQVTISGNQATAGDGGGVYLTTGSFANLIGSTVSGNSATGQGGGVFAQAPHSEVMHECTIAFNSAGTGGGGLFVTGGDIDVGRTIFGNNTTAGGSGPDVSGTLYSTPGENLFSDTGGLGFTMGANQSGNILNQDPLLAPLANNGGWTLTHALQPGSPAIDAADTLPVTGDQRGAPRPGGGDSDIGAFELGALPPEDFGDAPPAAESGFAADYPVTLAQDGARHRTDSGAMGPLLGERDVEIDGQPSGAADADDVSGDSADDEDNVTFSALIAGSAASVTVGNIGDDGFLDAWMDFNRDGDWEDPGEKIVDAATVAGLTSPSFSFDVPISAPAGTTFARVRVSTRGDLMPTGIAADGEVADFLVTISSTSTPEIVVFGNTVEIADEDATPSLGDHTDFGNAAVSSGTVTRTFVVRNSGSATLNLSLPPTISGANAAEFSVLSNPAGSVSPGGATSFELIFTPVAVGARTARVALGNTDADENPYDFAIQGTGTVELDFGDAPDVTVGQGAGDYDTLLANDGPRHNALGPTLGSNRDGEGDARPTVNADGDDTNTAPDDEDGVVFSALNPNTAASATVTVQNAPSGAKLNAWIDYNQNGVFELSEQVATDAVVNNGPNTVNFAVPAGAVLGTTYGRFRLDSAGGLGATGAAADGEVEDYKVSITDPAGNDPPVFAIGPNQHVESSPSMPVAVSVAGWATGIGPGDAGETAQTVGFQVMSNDNPGLFAVQPAVASSGPGSYPDSALTFTLVPGANGIANVSVAALDDGAGAPQSAAQSFRILAYTVMPQSDDLLIADRGPRVFTGALLLLHTDPGPGDSVQNLLDDGLVDAYDVTVRDNDGTLEYVVLDYETIVSAKGRGRQGLFGVDSVTLARRTISEGQYFRVPVAVDKLADGRLIVADSEFEPNVGKLVVVDPAQPSTANQSLLLPGGSANEFFWVTGMSVAPAGAPNAGKIYVSDVGNVLGKTVQRNAPPRKIIEVDPGTGDHTVLFSGESDTGFTSAGGVITTPHFPVGIDVDPATGDLVIADAFARKVWRMAPAVGAPLFELSVDSDFRQPTHVAIQGTLTSGKVFVSDAKADAPAGQRLLHRIDPTQPKESNSTVFTQDGVFAEPRGLEIVPAVR